MEPHIPTRATLLDGYRPLFLEQARRTLSLPDQGTPQQAAAVSQAIDRLLRHGSQTDRAMARKRLAKQRLGPTLIRVLQLILAGAIGWVAALTTVLWMTKANALIIEAQNPPAFWKM
jgi:hypothetical protein